MTGTPAELIKISIALPPAKALHFRHREHATYGHGMPALRGMELYAKGHICLSEEYLTAINPLRTRNHDADWLRKRYKQLRRQALQGDGEALNDLAWIIFNELCYPANQYLAKSLFELAAVMGCSGEAWFNLAEQLNHELVHDSDSVKKQNCFYRMAEAEGIAAAASRLGYLYWGSLEGHEVDLE